MCCRTAGGHFGAQAFPNEPFARGRRRKLSRPLVSIFRSPNSRDICIANLHLDLPLLVCITRAVAAKLLPQRPQPAVPLGPDPTSMRAVLRCDTMSPAAFWK